MSGKVRNIALDCSTFYRWSVMAKPVESEPVIVFKGLVEAIAAEIVSAGPKAVAGAKAWAKFTADARDRVYRDIAGRRLVSLSGLL